MIGDYAQSGAGGGQIIFFSVAADVCQPSRLQPEAAQRDFDLYGATNLPGE